MPRRRADDDDFYDIDTTHLGAATPAAGMPKRVPKKQPFPMGFDTNPDHYRQKPRKRRKPRNND